MPSTGHPVSHLWISAQAVPPAQNAFLTSWKISLQSPWQTKLCVLAPPLGIPKAGFSPDPTGLGVSYWLCVPQTGGFSGSGLGWSLLGAPASPRVGWVWGGGDREGGRE